jgi:glycogen debranching enzyme
MERPLQAPADAFVSGHSRCAWCGPSLLALGPDGWLDGAPVSGLYFREARHLSALRLELFGEAPVHASLADVAPARLEAAYLYPPVGARRGGGSGSGRQRRRHGVLERGLDLRLVYRVRPASLEVDLDIAARWDEEADVELAWRLGADFADLLELDDPGPPLAGEVVTEARPGGVTFRPRRGDLPLATRVVAGGAEWAWDGQTLAARVRLSRQRPLRLALRVEATDDEPLTPADETVREEALRRWRGSVTRVAAPAAGAFADRVARGVDTLGSLALLDGPPDEWLAPAAGVPLYPAFFGRDALTAGWQATVLDRGQILAAAHARVCRLQGTADDPWRDEQPGRVVQQVRRGPRSRLGEVPFDRYYGDVASPLMLLISVGQLYAWSGDREELARRWPQAMRTVEWVLEHGDRDGDGFLEYETRSPAGPVHQGWKDSDNAVVDGRGEPVAPPLAPCEVQGYWFAALQILAVLALVLGEPRRARRFWRRARHLRRRFDEAFWMEDEGCPAVALDADKRPVRAVTSNAGHCLASGILRPERVPAVVERLFRPDMFSGWGVRTLSADNPAYQPLSYHLGSVWPVENATLLLGLRRYGCERRTVELATALWELAGCWRGGFVPECVGGYARGDGAHPGAYPHANAPQAWNESVWPLMVQTLLGLQPAAPLSLLTVDPVLPEWLPEIELRGLRVGAAAVDLRCWRDGRGRGRFRVTGRSGRLRVVRQPPVNELDAGLLRRLGALARGAVGR